MVAIPLGKMFILAVKQVAKPMAKGIKNASLNSPFVKNYLVMPIGQGFNWMDVKIKTSLMGAKGSKVYKLNEKVAVEYGAELISELFIYFVGSSILLYEYSRSSAKEEKKEQKQKEEADRMRSDIESLQSALMEASFLMEEQSAEIRSLTRQLGGLHTTLENLTPSSPNS